MRNIKFLIKEARQNTNTVDNESIPDSLCTALLNRSLNYLVSELVKRNNNIRIFPKEVNIGFAYGTKEYDLPWDVYTNNSIINLRFESNGYNSFLDQISDKNRTDRAGYIVIGKKIIVNPTPVTYGNFYLKYNAKTPLFGLSAGIISAIDPNVSITVSGLAADFSETTEYFCVVDKYGEILKSREWVNQTLQDLLMSDTSGLSIGDVVVPGYYATTHCPLPDELEPILINMLEVLINARLSSTDLPVSDAISSAQLDSLVETFSDNSADPIIPPILEYREWV